MKRGSALVPVLLAFGCGSPPPPMKPPTVVALFEPSLPEPKLPLPNLLATDPDTGRLDVADPTDANDAEKAFYAWLRTLRGFPVTSVATADFSAPIDPATVSPSTVLLFELTDGTATALTPKALMYDAAKLQLRVEYLWRAGRTYAVALLGGPSGLKGANGEAVVGTQALDLLRAKYPLVTCADLADSACRSANPGIKGDTIDDERKKAVKMERARLAAAVALAAIEAGGTPRENLAAVWSFRTQPEVLVDPVVNFEPAVRAIPFPNDALMKDGKVALPEEPGDDALVTQTKSELNRLDGFSTTAAIVTERQHHMGAVGLTLQVSTLMPSHFQLLDLDANAAPVTVSVSTKLGPDQILLKPERPLRSHRRYAVLWTKGVKTNDGQDIGPSPAWAMLTAGAPFVDGEGKSRVRTLDDARAQDLERLRASALAGVAAAEGKGVARADLLLAWTFTTQTTGPTLATLRGKPAEWSLPTAVSGVAPLTQVGQLSLISNVSGKDFHSAVRSGVEGVFVTGNALNLMGQELDLTVPESPVPVDTEGPFTDATLAMPRQEQLKFMLVLPRTPKHADGRIPIIIFQHGITRFRRDALFISNAIARQGYATLAIDHPMHGDRSYCTSSADCAAGSTCTDHRCPPGGYRLAEGLDGLLGTPAVSGLKFSSTTNLAATRDQIRQLMIDTAQLVRVVQDTTAGIGSIDVDDPMTMGVTERLEVSELGYIGMSLGSVMGTLAVAANPEITRATFNVGGASPADILTQATVPFLSDKRRALDRFLLSSRNIAPGDQEYDDFYDVARWMLDTADAQNFGRNYIDEPLPMYPKKRIFISWVQGDPWVPNATTQLLINSIERMSAPMNFGEHMWIAGGNHSFLMDPSAAVVLMAQDEAVGWIAAP